MKFSEHLSQIFRDRGITQVEAAKQIGVSRQLVGRWLIGESEPDRKNLIDLAAFLRLPPAYLMLGNDGAFTPEDIQDDTIAIPVMCVESPNEFFEPAKSIRSIRVEKNWIQSKSTTTNLDALRIINIEGDNMRPTLIRGDYAIVDTSINTFTIEGIYLVKIQGQMMIKRLLRNLDGSLELKNDHAQYPSLTVPTDSVQAIEIIGKCIISCPARAI